MNYEELNSLIEQYQNNGGDMSNFQSYVNAMASDSTTSLGLNQWKSSDKPVMEDFNRDNRIIDENLRGLWAQKVSKDPVQWQQLQLINGASHHPTVPVKYTAYNGVVYITGILIANSLSQVHFATLPDGYGPAINVHVALSSNASINTELNKLVRPCFIATNGKMSVYPAASPWSAGDALCLNLSYPVGFAA